MTTAHPSINYTYIFYLKRTKHLKNSRLKDVSFPMFRIRGQCLLHEPGTQMTQMTLAWFLLEKALLWMGFSEIEGHSQLPGMSEHFSVSSMVLGAKSHDEQMGTKRRTKQGGPQRSLWMELWGPYKHVIIPFIASRRPCWNGLRKFGGWWISDKCFPRV